MLGVRTDGFDDLGIPYRPQIGPHGAVVVGHLESFVDAPGVVIAQHGSDIDVVADGRIVFLSLIHI